MMRPTRVSLLVGTLVLGAALGYAGVTERHSNFRGLEGLRLIGALATFGLLLGSLAVLGSFLGLRPAPPERLTYKTGVIIALIYFGFCYLTSFAPIEAPTVLSDGRPNIKLLVFLLLIASAMPYLIALTWRLTIVGGVRER